MKTLYLESVAGIAGDMFAASFVNSGLVEPHELYNLSKTLGIPDIEIHVSEVIRASIQATHIDVLFDESEWLKRFPSAHHHSHKQVIAKSTDAHVPFRELEQIILQATLDKKTKKLACRILDSLAESEAQCHGVIKDEVVFHEIGMLDSLMDIVMAAYCINKVAPDRIVSSPIKLGRGMIATSHGMQPVPPPVSAVLALGMPISSMPASIDLDSIELSTPTGLAILKTLQPLFSKNWPEGTLLAKGSGAGTMELQGFPNLFRISLFETLEQATTLPYESDMVTEISANYDDSTPEHLAWATKKLFACGALDVWQTTAMGKKGRVMIVLSLLVEKSSWTQCVDFILCKTSTFGLRYKHMDRLKLRRHFETRVTNEGSFQVKIGCNTQGEKIKEKFEFDELQKVWDRNLPYSKE